MGRNTRRMMRGTREEKKGKEGEGMGWDYRMKGTADRKLDDGLREH